MLPKDFRGYLDYLESKGKLLRVKQEVDVKHEIAAGIRKVSDNDGPALLFENLKGFPGWRMAGGLFATKKLMALALETEPDEEKLLQKHLEFDQKRIKSKLVPTGPVKEIILKGDQIDLTKLPVPTYCEKDSGPYIIPAAEIARDPVTGIQNVTIGRRQVMDKTRTTLAAFPMMHLGLIARAGEEMGREIGVAIVLGAPPEVTIASQIKAPMGVDELEIAGALRGEPIEVVKCETIDVDVPAHAEIIIEGVIVPGERSKDGPFGEYPGDYRSGRGYVIVEDRAVVKTTAITMRRNPIFQAILSGKPMTENHWLKKWSYAAAVYRVVKDLVPRPEDIKGINLTPGGGAGNNVVVAIHKRLDRTPVDIIQGLLSTRLWLKNVIVVDEDIDIYDASDVEWAWSTRILPQRDIIITNRPGGVAGVSIDAGLWGINATKPLVNGEWFVKATPPGVDKVNYV